MINVKVYFVIYCVSCGKNLASHRKTSMFNVQKAIILEVKIF